MPLRPCLNCGVLGSGTRCVDCYRARQRRRNAQEDRRIYDRDWRAHSRGRRAEQPWCSGCGTVSDLTVDHPSDAVLCRRCHGELEARRRG
jgi:hypothetical protein